jgi:hypothetical protein
MKDPPIDMICRSRHSKENYGVDRCFDPTIHSSDILAKFVFIQALMNFPFLKALLPTFRDDSSVESEEGEYMQMEIEDDEGDEPFSLIEIGISSFCG